MRYRSHLECKHAYVSFPQKNCWLAEEKKSRPTTQSGSRRSFLHFRLFPTTKLKQAAAAFWRNLSLVANFHGSKNTSTFLHIVHMKKEQLEEKSVLRPVYF